MLLLPDDQLDERRRVASSALAPLADALAADLEPLLGREIYLPTAKALLSRAGGRCPDDGSALEFDPFAPDTHRCPTCGRTFGGELHHRWWVYSYQLWLAERAVHASLLHLLRGDPRLAALARAISLRYARAYESYPNRDNVLGPSRLFFSTYLESIWLLQLCVTADLLAAAGDGPTAREVRDRIVGPGGALIAQYDEGLSNRQVWNNAALLAAALSLGDRAGAERIVRARSGVETHLRYGLLHDGTWYEGENYHLFAHRGLWYAIVMAETAGIGIEPALLARFDEGFATPFATALPDLTLPSRKDSQYAVSLQQPRFAELCELGLARHRDQRLAAALTRFYSSDAPSGDAGRARSTADVERNGPAVRLSRSDLGWRSLLHACVEPPTAIDVPLRSAHLEAQGIAVFRRERGRVYVALDYGQSGGGHGHPDRLNLLFAQDQARWLDDLGTGSYVDRSLHWYRSTLAHNAPMAGGHSQARVSGTLRAYDERGGVGWVLAHVGEIAPGVSAQRAIVVTPDYFVDELRWSASAATRFELPVHFDADFASGGVSLEPVARLDGGDGLEDGFTFASDATTAELGAAAIVRLRAPAARSVSSNPQRMSARAWVSASGVSRWFRAHAPGQPAQSVRPFYLVRCEGTGGVIRSVWAWSPRVDDARFDGDKIVVTLGAEQHVHFLTPEHWQLELSVGGAASGIELAGWRAPADDPAPPSTGATAARATARLQRGVPARFELGESHYRQSEQSWADAGRPAATVSLIAQPHELVVDVDVRAGAPTFVPADAVNPYDNEPADINGHGVQFYVTTPGRSGAWMLVPEPGRGVRLRRIEGWGDLAEPGAEWATREEGFRLTIHLSLPREFGSGECPIDLDVLINETEPTRERRRGQLVLSGAAGEFVYLLGDRHDPARLLHFLAPP